MDSLPGRGTRLTLIGAAVLLVAGGMAVYHRPFETVRSAMRSGLRLSGISE